VENLKIGFLLHFYQPWWQRQFPAVLRKISDQSYRPILRLLNDIDGFCFTANINLSLLELLENDFSDVRSGFKDAVDGGKIELTGSPAQHPILPLIPEFLQRAQIEDDGKRKESQFGIKRNCRGFYLPEMAFRRSDVGLLKELGYKWTVIDDEPFVAVYGSASVPFNHMIVWNGFKTYMRSGLWSNKISSGKYSFYDIKAQMEHELGQWVRNEPAYLIIAMDGETFGHHHGHLIDQFLRPMLEEWAGNKIVPIETLEQSFPWRSVQYLPDGSWSTSAEDIRKNDPYPLWNSRFNRYHYMLWKLVNSGLNYFEQCEDDCFKMTSSCHWWWISGRPYWEPEFMKFGAKKAIEIVRQYGSLEEVNTAEKLYKDLKELH